MNKILLDLSNLYSYISFGLSIEFQSLPTHTFYSNWLISFKFCTGMVGQTIAHYQIMEKLGSGGMATVYKARDTKLERFVALKFLHKDLIDDEVARKRIVQEARAASKLDHPNIATIYEISETGTYIFISMAFYQGQTLRQLINSKHIDYQTFHSIASQIAAGIDSAHKSGIIHRDIKPENILITEDLQVKILDFGIARVQDFPALTRQETVVGTAAYMSPEQVEGLPLDERTDIFSFGAVMYEMLAGEKPFQGDYSTAISYAIVHEDPKNLPELRPDVPPPIQAIIDKALNKDREQRYGSAEDVRNDLQALVSGETAQVEVPRKPAPQAQRKFFSRPRLLAGTLLILLFTAGAYFWASHRGGVKTQQNITIFPFAVIGDDPEWDWLGQAVSELLNTQLARNAAITTTGAQERIRLQSELGYGTEALSLDKQLALARKAKSDKLVVGDLQRRQERVVVRARLIDSNSGETLQTFAPLEKNYKQLNELALSLAGEVAAATDASRDAPSESDKSRASFSSIDVFRYYLEGRDAAFDRRYQESIQKLTRAIELDPTFIEPYYWLAYQYGETGDYAKAKDVLARGKPYISALSRDAKLKYLSQEAMVDGRWKDYVAYLDQLLRQNPDDAKLHFNYGFTIAKKFRNLDAGIASMLQAIRLDSTYSFAYNELGYAYLEKGDKKHAFEMIDKYIGLNPADVNPLDSKAELLYYTGEYAQAIEYCERILEIQPDFLSAYAISIRSRIACGEYSAAQAGLEQYFMLVANAHFRALGHILQARLFAAKQDPTKALEEIKTALGFEKNNLEAHWLKGVLYRKLNNAEHLAQSVAELKRIFAARGDLYGRWFLHHLQGEQALLAGHTGQAVSSFKKVLELGPRRRDFFLAALANAYVENQQIAPAIQTYGEALKFNPANGLAAFALATLYESKGNLVQASAYFRRALKSWESLETPIKEQDVARQKLASLN